MNKIILTIVIVGLATASYTDLTVCPSGYTSCYTKDGQEGCCPFENATCCDDGLHCCPNGYKCNLSQSSCEKRADEALVFLTTEQNTELVYLDFNLETIKSKAVEMKDNIKSNIPTLDQIIAKFDSLNIIDKLEECADAFKPYGRDVRSVLIQIKEGNLTLSNIIQDLDNLQKDSQRITGNCLITLRLIFNY